MFVELHMLQNFVPGNLNRDDTGSPKDCDFGGYRRGRISSQCLKRSMRKSDIFTETTKADIAYRTMWVAGLLKKKLIEKHDENDIDKIMEEVVPKVFSKLKDGKTETLIFIGMAEADVIAKAIDERWNELAGNDKQIAQKACDELISVLKKKFKDGITSAPDIALFGRMLASNTGLNINVDAACQVAHALSTNKLSMEFDYFTAVDDLQPEDETGSAHLSTTQFNSSCYYRYSNIDLKQLKKNLANDEELTRRTVEAFIRASVEAVPTGKQNSFAARQKPEFILSIVRNDAPVNLANAFENPIKPGWDGNTSLVEKSIEALDTYYGRLVNCYGEQGVIAKAVLQVSENPTQLNALNVKPASFDALVKTIIDNINFD